MQQPNPKQTKLKILSGNYICDYYQENVPA